MALIDPHHPFYKRIWVRVFVTVLPVAWSLVEFTSGNMMWGFVFLAAGCYAGLTFWSARGGPKD
jgi:hypothetical protein